MQNQLSFQHYKTKAKESKEIPPCPICNKTFPHLKRRGEHLKNCEKSFVCEECFDEFKSKQALIAHQNKHTMKHKCNLCGKCFESNYKLNRHLLTHEKTKSFSCTKCGKSFSRKDNLSYHQKTKRH